MNSVERLKAKYHNFELYNAGLPGFPRNFPRDSILSAMLMNNTEMLKNQLLFCELRQGSHNIAFNGEEKGKIFHEYPAIGFKGLSTEFNACDTTALYLIGHEFYKEQTGDKSLAGIKRRSIESATKYILSHLKDYAFIEDPKFCGAEKFALNVTYWKDSDIVSRKQGQPIYPVIYTLAHIQNMKGLRAAAKLLESKNLEEIAEKMSEKLKDLYDPKTGIFYLAIDKEGPISAISSDLLHSLFYLEPKDISQENLNKIVEVSKILETPVGYRALSPEKKSEIKENYHSSTVWPFEQAIIHAGAKKFGLKRPQEITQRVMKFLDTDPEIFEIQEEIKKGNNDPQLWTIAAKKYFNSLK